MPSFGGLFGKAKTNPTVQESAQQLKETLQLLDKRQAHLERKIDTEKAIAREKSKQGNKRAAIMAIKRKKIHENALDQVSGSKLTLEMQISSLEQAQTTFAVLNQIRESTRAMEREQGGMSAEDVEDLMEEVRERNTITNDIGAALANPSVFGGMELDEDEILAELDLLEEQELEEEFSKVPAVSVTPLVVPVAQSAKQVLRESAEERELRQLEESMALQS